MENEKNMDTGLEEDLDGHRHPCDGRTQVLKNRQFEHVCASRFEFRDFTLQRTLEDNQPHQRRFGTAPQHVDGEQVSPLDVQLEQGLDLLRERVEQQRYAASQVATWPQPQLDRSRARTPRRYPD